MAVRKIKTKSRRLEITEGCGGLVVVRNLKTGQERWFALPDRQALVAAWEQDRGNFDRETYGDSTCPVERGKSFYFAGDLAVKRERV